MSSISAPAFAIPQNARSCWVWHLSALAAVTVTIIALFRFDVWNAVEVWWIYPTYSHCFLIIPISAWLLWERRDILARRTPVTAPKALFAVLPVMMLWLVGNFATITEFRQFAVIGFLEIAALTLLGPQVFRAILFPALYLFFLVPFGQYLIPPMQDFATWFTDAGLSVLGVPHYTEGTTIELTNGRFEIAEACAGLRFLIATLALGVLFAHIAYRKWYKRVLFLMSCIVVPLIGNGLRCLGIIELAHLSNNKIAVGVDHLIYGWIFNTAILLVLMLVGLSFRDSRVSAKPLMDLAGQSNFSRLSVTMAAVATALTVAMGPAFSMWHDQRPITVNPGILTSRINIAGWTEKLSGTWRPFFGGADSLLMTNFVAASDDSLIDVAIAYYARNRAEHSLIAATNHVWDEDIWHGVETRSLTASFGTDPVRLNEAVIATASQQRLVWWTYWTDGRFTTSATTVKLLQLETAFTGHEAAALIAFSISIDGAVEDARVKLEKALAGLGNPSDKPATVRNR